MFLPARSGAAGAAERPHDTAIAAGDWHVLAGFWHPVAFAHEIADRPVAARLLDVPLVLWRTAAGVHAARDLCPHRGARLSAGRVVADQLVCPMHGLHYAGDGACTRIPSIPDPAPPIPARLRLAAHRCAEHLGIVWVCLKDEPLWPLPQWDGIADPALRKVFMPVFDWRSSAARHLENFNDVAHFPWVHGGSFGAPGEAVMPPYEVRQEPYGLSFAFPYREGVNRFPDAEGAGLDRRDVVYTYELTYPFATLIKVAPVGSGFVHYFADVACPVSATECRIFQLCTDTSGEPDPDYWIKDSLAIVVEDQPLVEGQPPLLPLDLRQEIHIPADRLSLAWRRGLVQRFGLGGGA